MEFNLVVTKWPYLIPLVTNILASYIASYEAMAHILGLHQPYAQFCQSTKYYTIFS